MGNSESRAERDEALFIAAAHGDEEKLAELIEIDGNINHIAKEKEYDGATPTIAAVQNNALGCLRLLLECSDVEYDRADACRYTPLHYAAKMGHAECIEALLAAGADLANRTSDGSTALHLAAEHDRADCLRLLLRHESARELLDADAGERSVLQIARSSSAECEREVHAALIELEARADGSTQAGETARLLRTV